MVGGHLLVATRGHRVKVADMGEEEGREMGEFLIFVFVCSWGLVWEGSSRRVWESGL
jgi:hypothetical protein